ncbi:hypothetical protein EON63_14700 [archaeon]|nr:MAG: hypothetical protein EON63_14700 [archaeon]
MLVLHHTPFTLHHTSYTIYHTSFIIHHIYSAPLFLCRAELDAIGTKRYGGEQSGDREVQRTMLELLNQLDGFSSNDKIKVCCCPVLDL